MARIEFAFTDVLTDDVDRLRMLCFPAAPTLSSSRDAFDARSTHVLVLVDHAVAAYGRLTPGPMAVFESWTKGVAQIPTGPAVADLGRCLVAPRFRGLGMFSLVCLQSLMFAAERGFTNVVGAVIPGQRHAASLYAIGFHDSGPVVQGVDSTGRLESIQPLVADCSEVDRWKVLRTDACEALRYKGLDVRDGRMAWRD